MLVVKSLYGLTTSAARWHEELSKTLRSMGFTPTKADHYLWLKDCGTHYEYLCTWVDDIIVASKDAKAILEEFKTKAKYTLKGVGTPSYYLGGNFGRLDTTLLPLQAFYQPRRTSKMSMRRLKGSSKIASGPRSCSGALICP